MNPTQRRGVLLISVAVIGAIGVFVLVSNYVSDVRSQLGPTVSVVVAAEDLPPLASPQAEQLTTVEMPQRWVPPNALRNTEVIANQIAATTIPTNTILSEGMFIDRPALEPGEREIAILVDAETGVGGKITPGARVDIFATFAGVEATEATPAIPASSRVVVQLAEVIEVGSPFDVNEDGEPIDGGAGFGSSQQVPVTFRLSVEDANRVLYVESFAASLRLALRSPLDLDVIDDPGRSIFDALDELGSAFDPVASDPVTVPPGDDAVDDAPVEDPVDDAPVDDPSADDLPADDPPADDPPADDAPADDEPEDDA